MCEDEEMLAQAAVAAVNDSSESLTGKLVPHTPWAAWDNSCHVCRDQHLLAQAAVNARNANAEPPRKRF